MAIAGGKNVDENDPIKRRKEHQKAMRDVVEKAWDAARNKKIKNLLENGPMEDGPKHKKDKGAKHRKP